MTVKFTNHWTRFLVVSWFVRRLNFLPSAVSSLICLAGKIWVWLCRQYHSQFIAAPVCLRVKACIMPCTNLSERKSGYGAQCWSQIDSMKFSIIPFSVFLISVLLSWELLGCCVCRFTQSSRHFFMQVIRWFVLDLETYCVRGFENGIRKNVLGPLTAGLRWTDGTKP